MSDSNLTELLTEMRWCVDQGFMGPRSANAMRKAVMALESRASNAGGAVAAGYVHASDLAGLNQCIAMFKKPSGDVNVPLYTHPAPASKEPVADERMSDEHLTALWRLARMVDAGYWIGQARAALATAQTVPEPKSSNHNAGGTQAYLATEHYNEGWNDCRNAMLAAAPAKPEGV